MKGIAVDYLPTSIAIVNNEGKSELHSYISDDNEQDACDIHSRMGHIFKKSQNQKDQCLVCQQYGMTLMVFQINIGVLWLYIY